MNKFLILFSAFFLSACLYEAPDEDYLQMTPTTNNPHITREKSGFNPGVSY